MLVSTYRSLLGAASLALLASTADAQTPKPPPSADSLRAITARGIALAENDAAAWHASDAVMALRPAAEEIGGYVALQAPQGWIVAFGRFTAARDTFYVTYEARAVPQRPDSFVATPIRPARPDTGDVARAARALDLARSDAGTPNRPYNFAALRGARGEWLVYAMPAQTRSNVWPLGGDTRYQVSPDGRTVMAKRRLHQSILETVPAKSSTGQAVAGTHTAVLDDIPEDTDVFHVLVRRPHVPEIIVTDAFVYQVDPNGSIRLMGRREALLGR